MAHKKVKELSNEHYESSIPITQNRICADCPRKINANHKDNVIFGIGNKFADIMMILPNYDVNAKIGYPTILDILKKQYETITGNKLLENVYVTRFIKCIDKSQYNTEYQAFVNCNFFLFYEINKIKPKKIISFDKTYNGVLDYHNISYINVINPAVMFYDDHIMKDVFIRQLKESI